MQCIHCISSHFLRVITLMWRKIYIWLKWSQSPARPAAAPRPALVSMFIHTEIQTSKRGWTKREILCNFKGELLSLWRLLCLSMVARLIAAYWQINYTTTMRHLKRIYWRSEEEKKSTQLCTRAETCSPHHLQSFTIYSPLRTREIHFHPWQLYRNTFLPKSYRTKSSQLSSCRQ